MNKQILGYIIAAFIIVLGVILVIYAVTHTGSFTTDPTVKI
jgi:hypothetical protein